MSNMKYVPIDMFTCYSQATITITILGIYLCPDSNRQAEEF